MFHYINWRPTDVIKKHSLPSETEFFLNKEGDINPPPPPPRTKRQRNRTKCPNKRGLRTKVSEQKEPNKRGPSSTIKTISIKRIFWSSRESRQSASRESREDNQHQEKPPQDDFLVSDVTKDEEIFFWFQTSPDQEGPTFFWLQTSPRDDSPRSQTSPQKSL